MKKRRLVTSIVVSIIGFLMLSVLWFPIEQAYFDTLAENNLRKGSDFEFLILNLETATAESLMRFNSSFIHGATCFTNNGTQYLGFSERIVTDSIWNFTFSNAPLVTPTHIQTTSFLALSRDQYDNPWFIGLTVEYIEEVPLFTALIRISESYHLIQFALNGTVLKNQKILENHPIFFNPMEIEALGNGSWCLLVGRFENEGWSSFPSSTIITIDAQGTVSHAIYLDVAIQDFVISNPNASNFEMLTLEENLQFIEKRTINNEIVESYPTSSLYIPRSYFGLEMINSTHLLIPRRNTSPPVAEIPEIVYFMSVPLIGMMTIHLVGVGIDKWLDWREKEIKQERTGAMVNNFEDN
ncbi:MAG: hypothetical protein ACFFC7_05990 [Candidatus Hermodarchaeota archaeon]